MAAAGRWPRWEPERVDEPVQLLVKNMPVVPIHCRREGINLRLTGGGECRPAGGREMHVELPPVSGVASPGDVAAGFQTGKDPAKRLALDMNLCCELLLVQRTGRDCFEGNDGGTGHVQRRQRLVLAAPDQAGSCHNQAVGALDVRFSFACHWCCCGGADPRCVPWAGILPPRTLLCGAQRPLKDVARPYHKHA